MIRIEWKISSKRDRSLLIYKIKNILINSATDLNTVEFKRNESMNELAIQKVPFMLAFLYQRISINNWGYTSQVSFGHWAEVLYYEECQPKDFSTYLGIFKAIARKQKNSVVKTTTVSEN